ncbi:MAG: HEPN domain-containing protein [Candidatus Aenigmatarchaeota archaeon]
MDFKSKKLRWCLKQRKGIKLVKPSDNLCRAFFSKAKLALKSTIVNAKAGLIDWAISASYYAKYFSVYAILSKIGIKSEIHDCTLEVFNFLFSEKIKQELIEDIITSKEERIEAQYYTQVKTIKDLNKLIENTRSFINELEELAENISEEDIESMRGKLLIFKKHKQT